MLTPFFVSAVFQCTPTGILGRDASAQAILCPVGMACTDLGLCVYVSCRGQDPCMKPLVCQDDPQVLCKTDPCVEYKCVAPPPPVPTVPSVPGGEPVEPACTSDTMCASTHYCTDNSCVSIGGGSITVRSCRARALVGQYCRNSAAGCSGHKCQLGVDCIQGKCVQPTGKVPPPTPPKSCTPSCGRSESCINGKCFPMSTL